MKTVFFLFLMSCVSICANAQIRLAPISINGFSKDKIIEVLKEVGKNALNVNSLKSNYSIEEKLNIDNIFSIDTIYSENYFYNLKRGMVRNKSNSFLGKYLDFELSRAIFVYYNGDFSYTLSKNLFMIDFDSYTYSMRDLDSIYNISFESKTTKGDLFVDKKTMQPIAINQEVKAGTVSGRSFNNHENKFRLDIEYLVKNFWLSVNYQNDSKGLYISSIKKRIDLRNYKITRRDIKNKSVLLNDILNEVKSEVRIIRK